MSTLEKAMVLLKRLSPEKLDIVIYLMESLMVKQQIESMNIEEITPEDAMIIDAALAELESGLGVDAESVWEEAGI
ncbi:hypothetical protein [Syntrophomonas curvata]